MKKYLPIIIIAAIIVAAVSAFLVTGYGEKVSAIVNGEKITEKELDTRVGQIAAMYGYDMTTPEGQLTMGYLRGQVLQSLIEEKLILADAKAKNIEVDHAKVDEEMKKIKSSYSSDEEYQAALKERKFTEKDLKTFIGNQLAVDQLITEVTKDLTATTRDIKGYYEENMEEFVVQEMIKARNIVVETEDEAKAVIERLDKGEDFAKLAVELSTDPTAKDNQGEIGYFDKDANFIQEFKDAAFALKVGEYTKKPVGSMFGFHVIKVEDKKPATQRTFDEVKEELAARFLSEEKNEKFSAYVDELLKNAKIENKFAQDEEAAEGELSEEPSEEESSEEKNPGDPPSAEDTANNQENSSNGE